MLDFAGRITRRAGSDVLAEPVYQSMRHWMLQLDPPDHGRLRSLVVRAFLLVASRTCARASSRSSMEIVKVEPRGHMDLITDFAFRLPVTVICEMLGIPQENREVFFTSSRIGGRLLDLAALSRTAAIEIQPWKNESASTSSAAADYRIERTKSIGGALLAAIVIGVVWFIPFGA
jgi:cytochrome P450